MHVQQVMTTTTRLTRLTRVGTIRMQAWAETILVKRLTPIAMSNCLSRCATEYTTVFLLVFSSHRQTFDTRMNSRCHRLSHSHSCFNWSKHLVAERVVVAVVYRSTGQSGQAIQWQAFQHKLFQCQQRLEKVIDNHQLGTGAMDWQVVLYTFVLF